jgi:hypothetical protein
MIENFHSTDGEANIGMLRLEGGLRYLGVEQAEIEMILKETTTNEWLWYITMAAVSADVLGSVESGDRPGMFKPGGPFYVPKSM